MIVMDRTTSSCFLLIITIGLGVVDSNYSDDSHNNATKEIRSCNKLVLVDGNTYSINHLRKSKFLLDFIGCPRSHKNRLKSCQIPFRVKSDNTGDAYKLCINDHSYYSGSCYQNRPFPKLIWSYGNETHETKCSDVTRSRRCAPPEEDLNLTYESDDLCSTMTYGILEIDKQSVPGLVNLISSQQCRESKYKYSSTKRGIVSNYKEDMSEKQYVCGAQFDVKPRVDEICFEFHRFDAYSGGASLVIDVRFKQLTFNYTNKPKRKLCLEGEKPNFVSFKVVPGTDPVKSLHHKFHVKFTTRDDSHNNATNEIRCNQRVLVYYKEYIHNEYRNKSLLDFVGCPRSDNNTATSCKVPFRKKLDNTRRAYRLCLRPYMFYLGSCYRDHSKLIVSYADETHEIKCSDALQSQRCAPPEEDLNLTYESDDLCSSTVSFGTLQIYKEKIRAMVNLISSEPCGNPKFTYSWTNKGIVSNYKEDMSEKQYVCDAHFIGENKANEICFEFERFDAYSGGASLVIDVRFKDVLFKQLTFNSSNIPRTKVCLQGQTRNYVVIFKVVPGTDPVKSLHHKFHVKFETKEYSVPYDENEDEDSWEGYDIEESASPRWFLILLAIPILACACCCQLHKRSKRGEASSIPDPERSFRRDAAESHPAFANASRYQTRRPSQQRQTGAGNSSVQEPSAPASSLIPMEPLTSSQTDSADPPPYETTCLTNPNVAPPTYDMLFPNETA